MPKYKYDTFGVMIDLSRNAVMSLDGWRKLLPILKKMKYDTVFLYMEDTYEVEGEPYFGYMRGRYSLEEMRELDELGASYGIEMIPCIQTLAHLDTLMHWRYYNFDAQGTLLVGDERNYELIDNMFSTLRKCFRTNKIHVGMDEAYNLGRGRYVEKYGYDTQGNIMKKHLARVKEIAGKYGYEMLMWSDMFFNAWSGNKYNVEKTEIPEEYRNAIPEGVIPVYWNYYSREGSVYDDMLYNHKQLTDKLWFAGGAWTWTGFVPNNKFSLETMIPAFEACEKYKVKNIFITIWGDNGGECSRLSVLPTLFYLSEIAHGNKDESRIKEKFKRFFGISFDDYMAIDEPNAVFPESDKIRHPATPAKYMLYSDYFNGFLDYTVSEGGGELYGRIAKRLGDIAKSSRRFGHIFDSASKLSSALEVKYELGIKTRKAYQAGDKEELARLVREDYPEAQKRIKIFMSAFEKQWMAENKPYGFEVQESRIATIIARTESCKRRIKDYLAGRISSIPELECDILPCEKGEPGKSVFYNGFRVTYTANVM